MYFPDLIDEYKQSLKELRASGGCSSMERDMKEAIQWMETGYDPAEYRAATRTDSFVMDHHLMQDLISYTDAESYVPDWMKENESGDDSWANEILRMAKMKNKIKHTLKGLTENERAIFVMIRAEYMSFGKVAQVLNVTKSTVQTHLRRAESKINSNISKEIASMSYDYLYSREA
ncbi:sigma factor-like helix-turn-helix DNA-binding protein [Metasolibacillus sp.]|uniref:sigma factor-like helix-turn-helix DNA-binding protein n=1 Tax=Metasolibacillus sp. TaxID=2703680 RepID=UPI0025E60CDA|nr:sigma factor-like helix-turn-helix DNA-binding protein [Metasolibacillus sp.]MCT6925297.1 helix-turn-helix domain-containing protein [Metasolibacillus sp.]MCT6941473.1 helix-turn-helix domain-containing protein [Metasolibacillus sp.]